MSASSSSVVGSKRSRTEAHRDEQQAVDAFLLSPAGHRLQRPGAGTSNELRKGVKSQEFLACITAALKDENVMRSFASGSIGLLADDDNPDDEGFKIRAEISLQLSQACCALSKACKNIPDGRGDAYVASTAPLVSSCLHLLVPVLADSVANYLTAAAATTSDLDDVSDLRGARLALQFAAGLFAPPGSVNEAGDDDGSGVDTSDAATQTAIVAACNAAEDVWMTVLAWSGFLADCVALADVAEERAGHYTEEAARLSRVVQRLAKLWDDCTLVIKECDRCLGDVAVQEAIARSGGRRDERTLELTAEGVTSLVMDLVQQPDQHRSSSSNSHSLTAKALMAERGKAVAKRNEVESKGLAAKADAGVAEALGRLCQLTLDAIEAQALAVMGRLQRQLLERCVLMDEAFTRALAAIVTSYGAGTQQLAALESQARETRTRLQEYSHHFESAAPTTQAALEAALAETEEEMEQCKARLAGLLKRVSRLGECLSLLPIECRSTVSSRVQGLLAADSSAHSHISQRRASGYSNPSGSDDPHLKAHLRPAFGKAMLGKKLLGEAFQHAVTNARLMSPPQKPTATPGKINPSQSSAGNAVPGPLKQVSALLQEFFPSPPAPPDFSSASMATSDDASNFYADLDALAEHMPLEGELAGALKDALKVVSKGYYLDLNPKPLPLPGKGKTAEGAADGDEKASSGELDITACSSISAAAPAPAAKHPKSVLAVLVENARAVLANQDAASSSSSWSSSSSPSSSDMIEDKEDEEAVTAAVTAMEGLGTSNSLVTMRVLATVMRDDDDDGHHDDDDGHSKGIELGFNASLREIIRGLPTDAESVFAGSIIRRLLSQASHKDLERQKQQQDVDKSNLALSSSSTSSCSSSSSSSSSQEQTQTQQQHLVPSKTSRSLFDAHALLGPYPQADFSRYIKSIRQREERAAMEKRRREEAEALELAKAASRKAGPSAKRRRLESSDEDEDEHEEEDDSDEEPEEVSYDDDNDESEDDDDSVEFIGDGDEEEGERKRAKAQQANKSSTGQEGGLFGRVLGFAKRALGW